MGLENFQEILQNLYAKFNKIDLKNSFIKVVLIKLQCYKERSY